MVEPQAGGWEVVPRKVGVSAPSYEGPWDHLRAFHILDKCNL